MRLLLPLRRLQLSFGCGMMVDSFEWRFRSPIESMPIEPIDIITNDNNTKETHAKTRINKGGHIDKRWQQSLTEWMSMQDDDTQLSDEKDATPVSSSRVTPKPIKRSHTPSINDPAASSSSPTPSPSCCASFVGSLLSGDFSTLLSDLSSASNRTRPDSTPIITRQSLTYHTRITDYEEDIDLAKELSERIQRAMRACMMTQLVTVNPIGASPTESPLSQSDQLTQAAHASGIWQLQMTLNEAALLWSHRRSQREVIRSAEPLIASHLIPACGANGRPANQPTLMIIPERRYTLQDDTPLHVEVSLVNPVGVIGAMEDGLVPPPAQPDAIIGHPDSSNTDGPCMMDIVTEVEGKIDMLAISPPASRLSTGSSESVDSAVSTVTVSPSAMTNIGASPAAASSDVTPASHDHSAQQPVHPLDRKCADFSLCGNQVTARSTAAKLCEPCFHQLIQLSEQLQSQAVANAANAPQGSADVRRHPCSIRTMPAQQHPTPIASSMQPTTMPSECADQSTSPSPTSLSSVSTTSDRIGTRGVCCLSCRAAGRPSCDTRSLDCQRFELTGKRFTMARIMCHTCNKHANVCECTNGSLAGGGLVATMEKPPSPTAKKRKRTGDTGRPTPRKRPAVVRDSITHSVSSLSAESDQSGSAGPPPAVVGKRAARASRSGRRMNRPNRRHSTESQTTQR